MCMMQALLLAALAALPRPAVATKPDLHFNDNGNFHISVFSDMHFGEERSGRGPRKDQKTQDVMDAVLDADHPDLVVLNGDLITGDGMDSDNSTDYLDVVLKPVTDRNLTFASTYGNHDHQNGLSPEKLLEREGTYDRSLTQKMVDDEDAGVTNYYLPVYPPGCTDCAPELLLWFFDSRGGFYYQQDNKPQPNWIHKSVVDWFNRTNRDLVEEHGKTIPSLAFVHIPVNATHVVQSEVGVDPNSQPGINEETPVVPQSADWCEEEYYDSGNCKYGGKDVDFMQALAGTRGIMGLFYGHDHGNSWCYRWDGELPGMNISGNGINLCYGQHTGYGGYGDWIRGGRQIVVNRDMLQDLAIDTYIRTENGDSIGSVTLNSTFNDDSYPKSPSDKTYLGKSSGGGQTKGEVPKAGGSGSMFPPPWSSGVLAILLWLTFAIFG